MTERKPTLGDRLLEAGRPEPDVSERCRKEVERLMEKEIRKMKWFTWQVWIVGGALVLMTMLFASRMDAATTVQSQLHFAFSALWALLFFVVIVVRFVSDRNALQIRKEIKELRIAVNELKEGLDKA